MRTKIDREIKLLHVLAFGPHPDDVDACCAGFLIKHAKLGKKVGIIDVTKGDLATNGTPAARALEAQEAAKIIGAALRYNLGFSEKKLGDSEVVQKKVIETLRTHKPRIVLAPYWEDRHPGHNDVSQIITRSLFYAGLRKWESEYPPHRPEYVFYYRLWNEFVPTFILDVSDVFAVKEKAFLAHRSQVSLEAGRVPTKNHHNDLLGYWKARHRKDGYEIGVEYGEPYLSMTPMGIKDLESVLPNYS